MFSRLNLQQVGVFEPEKVILNVDGRTDQCSQGKDINFVFKGFAITGQEGL
jgi:hypothetical protein